MKLKTNPCFSLKKKKFSLKLFFSKRETISQDNLNTRISNTNKSVNFSKKKTSKIRKKF